MLKRERQYNKDTTWEFVLTVPVTWAMDAKTVIDEAFQGVITDLNLKAK